MEQLQDIPRLYTALAEWSACMVILLVIRDRKNNIRFLISSAVMLIWQSCFLYFTGTYKWVAWAVCMFLAVLFLFLFLFLNSDLNLRLTLYYLAFAFLLAEFTASIEWQISTYLEHTKIPGFEVLRYGILIVVYGGIFWCSYHYEKKVLTKEFTANITGKETVSVVLLSFIFFVLSNLSYLTSTPFSSSVPFDIFIIRTLMDAIGLCMILAYQSKYHDFLVRKELEQLMLVLNKQYDEYRNLQETLEQLKILKHDMKHQIHGLRGETDPERREKWIREIEEQLEEDGLNMTTGNPVLDSILEIKLKTARKWKVHFSCIADGKLLAFMHVRDICALFGNALDNALESVIQVEDEQKRIIQMSVVPKNNMIYIQVRNYTENKLDTDTGRNLPGTTKKDTRSHGFGLKSISYCIEKYGGTMSVSLEQNWFQLSIMLPRIANETT